MYWHHVADNTIKLFNCSRKGHMSDFPKPQLWDKANYLLIMLRKIVSFFIRLKLTLLYMKNTSFTGDPTCDTLYFNKWIEYIFKGKYPKD